MGSNPNLGQSSHRISVLCCAVLDLAAYYEEENINWYLGGRGTTVYCTLAQCPRHCGRVTGGSGRAGDTGGRL